MAGDQGTSWVAGMLSGVRSLVNKNEASSVSLRKFAAPQSHEEWVDRYGWLHSAYIGEPYTTTDMKALGLFRALDPNGDVIAETTRLTRDIQHVVDIDAQALAGNTLTLDLAEGRSNEADRTAGLNVWRRSRLQRLKGRWARWCASMGDVMLEAVRTKAEAPYDVKIVAYDPRMVRVEYDLETGTEIERAVIVVPHFSAPTLTSDGVPLYDGRLHVYIRTLTRDAITVTYDGKPVAEESGVHGLGVVPLVHLPFVPYVDPCHGLWAAPGLEQSLALVDSLLTQVGAIGNRYASPMWVAKGFTIADGSDIGKVGRVLSGVPADGDFRPVEANLGGVVALLKAAQEAREMARSSLPEFLFSEAGANASGSSLSFRAASFVAKMSEVRGRWYPGLAEVTEMAVAMERGAEFDPLEPLFEVTAPPILPVLLQSELTSIHEVWQNGGLLREDYIGHLQRLGIVRAGVDAAQYAADTEEEQTAAAAAAQPGIDSLIKDLAGGGGPGHVDDKRGVTVDIPQTPEQNQRKT